jgi:PTS system nitrogen regulatory IIA component
MKILDILTSEALIAPALAGTSKTAVLRELAEHLVAQQPAGGIDVNRLVEVLWERERLGSTAIGDGIAIPHGKLPGLTGVIGAFGRHVAGVDFDSLDGSPTHLFFLLVAPEDSVGQHLKALARVSRLLKDRAFRDKLVAAADRAELFRLIREEDEKL